MSKIRKKPPKGQISAIEIWLFGLYYFIKETLGRVKSYEKQKFTKQNKVLGSD